MGVTDQTLVFVLGGRPLFLLRHLTDLSNVP